MQEEDNEQDVFEQENDQPFRGPIYSRWAIIGFSIFCSTFFGGVLLFINLKEAGYKRDAYQVLLFSLFYSIATTLGILYVGTSSVLFPIICNAGGWLILSEYFYKRFFPDTEEYTYKSIVRPLIIAVVLCLLLLLFSPNPGALPQ